MEKIWSDDAWDDYLFWQGQDKKTLKRINALIKSIERDGVMEGIGKPEPLKYRDTESSLTPGCFVAAGVFLGILFKIIKIF